MQGHAMMKIKPVVLGMACLLASHVAGSFYTEDWIFSRRPNESATMTSIDRFGPVGLGIELHQPAFVMKIGNVEEGSPAAETGQLRKGQMIETINGEPLRDIDPRIQLGNLITEAEAADGVIALVVRDAPDAPEQTVEVRIPVLGSYSPNWPLDCEKSDRIVRNLAAWTARQTPGITTDGGMRMLFLLSTGEEEDLAVVREWVHQLIERHRDGVSGGVNWHLGYGSIPLAEYYLRTGDEAALPLIQSAVDAAERNYMPGGWSTRGQGQWTYMGGGRMNAAGVHVNTFLLLAKECGVEVDETVLLGALRQHIRYAGRGNVAYGDQRPETGYTDNGKNGALAFTLAAAAAVLPDGERSPYARARDISAMRSFYSTHWMLHGHTGGGVGEIWRSAAMGLMHDKEAPRYRSFMDNRTWFYELSRRFDGSFAIVGGERYDNTAWGVGMGLTYTVPRRTLRITGAPPTRHSRQYALPQQIWGTAADTDFYSMRPAEPSTGEAPDVEGERLDGESGRVIMGRIASGDKSVIRKYIHHPDPELRRLAARRMNGMPELVQEALGARDARVRFAGVEAMDAHGSLLTEETTARLLEMIHDPEESWWVVDRALQALRRADPKTLKPHTSRLLYWMQHDDWWMSSSAIHLVMPLAAEGHALHDILQAVGRTVAQNRRFARWNPGMLTRGFEQASSEKQQALLGMLEAVYQSWPMDAPETTYTDPVHPQSESWFIDATARSIAALEGGLDRLFALSQRRYPGQTLAHRDLFLRSGRIEDNPAMQDLLVPLTRDELIPEFVVQHASTLLRAHDNPDRNVESRLEELVGLYRRIGVQEYGWHAYGPDRTEMEWEYHAFDPEEQPPPGQERARLGRYREVTYPEGMESWNQPDFDAEAAGWQRGLAPFASINGELRAVGGCRGDRGFHFCGCGEEPNTLWDKEVLLKRGFFEIPPFEEGYVHRILIGGMSHVGSGDGAHVYVNGRRIYHRTRAVDRRAGAVRIGSAVPREWWPEFASGRTHLAAKSFLKYYPGTSRYGNYMTVFLQRMEIPPLFEELERGMQRTPLRHAGWQERQDPDTNVDPAEGLHAWDGRFVANPEAVGGWKLVDQVDQITEFVPGARQHRDRRWRPPFDQIEIHDGVRTSNPLLLWTGTRLLDVDRREALAVEHHAIDGKAFLFVELGGFSPDRAPGWQPPWLVFEKR